MPSTVSKAIVTPASRCHDVFLPTWFLHAVTKHLLRCRRNREITFTVGCGKFILEKTMKKICVMAIFLAASSQAQATSTGGPETCEHKEQRILEQLSHAEADGNRGRIRGLTTALEALRANCTDEGLIAERREHISEHEAEVATRRNDLAEAIRDGDKDDIRKREKKLDEALQELEEARMQ